MSAETKAEAAIRDMAATVVNLVQTRADHPSYGVTKAAIRMAVHRLDGAVGLYMVLTDQAAHSAATSLARFQDQATEDRVTQAWQAWGGVR